MNNAGPTKRQKKKKKKQSKNYTFKFDVNMMKIQKTWL